MANDFSYIELVGVRKFMRKMPYEEIADILSLEVAEVAAYAEAISAKEGIVTFQQNLDAKAKRKKEKLVPAAGKRVGEKSAAVKKNQGRPPRAPKDKGKPAKKAKPLKELPPAVVFRQNAIIKKPVENAYQTKQVDYSKKVSVRIDSKTTIYINQGEDPTDAIHKYFENQRKTRDYLSEQSIAQQQQQKWKRAK